MAGAEELLLLLVPTVGAAEVRAVGIEGDHFAFSEPHHPGGGFLAGHLPAVQAIPAKDYLFGDAQGDLPEIGRLDPLFLAPRARGKQQVNARGQGQGGADQRPQPVDAGEKERAALGGFRHPEIIVENPAWNGC